MVSLLYLKHAYDLSDEELVARWSENVQRQYFSGMEYYTPKRPCDATQIGRFRRILGEPGVEELLKATIQSIAGNHPVRCTPPKLSALVRAKRVNLLRARVRMGLYLSPKQVLLWVNKLIALMAGGSLVGAGGQRNLGFTG